MENETSSMKIEQDVEEMKNCNYEKFKTLVRMHLSFELHLNTDELDFPCNELAYYEKGRIKVWNRLSKKIKACSSGRSSSSHETLPVVLTKELINCLKHLKSFLLKEENIQQEGIFRRNGAISRQNELKSSLVSGKLVELAGEYTAHDCAAVYKALLAELYEPLLTDAHYCAHCQLADLCNELRKIPNTTQEEHLLHSIQLLLLLLPDENRIVFMDIIEMLDTAAQNEKYNKMSADTLATLFSPHLICPRNIPPEVLHSISQNMCPVISYMITKGTKIFDIPPMLATDIRAYLLEKRKKRKASTETEIILNESVSDFSTVNTVFTFVDREKTAEAHNSNSTDTALAQLYAHIQCLPESSKKRKLIKQFNKENGQGTPLQLMMLNQLNNSNNSRCAKSISDSIKRHFLQKGFLCRTPKRKRTTPTCDTPNSCTSATKFRVLFDIPNSHNKSSNKSQDIETTKNDSRNVSNNSEEMFDETDGSNNRSKDDRHSEKCFKLNHRLFSRHKSEPNLSRILTCEGSHIKEYNVDNHSSVENIFKPETKKPYDMELNVTSETPCASPIVEKAIPCTFKELLVKRVMFGSSSDSFGKKSISPITKSTQKMPKAMQESIMTPRSRKPVMLTYNLNTSSGLDLSAFQQETEQLNSDTSDMFTSVESSLRRRSRSLDDLRSKTSPFENKENIGLPSNSSEDLSDAFRQYLVSRNVHAGSPTDSSFTSQSGDFELDPDFKEIDQCDKNSSLLYCLDGNIPSDVTLCQNANNSMNQTNLVIVEENYISQEETDETDKDFDETAF